MTEAVVWSPRRRFIAVAHVGSGGAVEILDAVTPGRLSTFKSSLGDTGETRSLIFSPDGRLLTWFGETLGKILSWDVQTGSVPSPRGNRSTT